MAKEKIPIYIYETKLKKGVKIEELKRKFNRAKMIQNSLKYRNDALLLIIEKIDQGFLFGRFLILRKDVPNILNGKTKQERDIILKKDEYVKEDSNFIWNFKDKYLFGEYNYHALRHFSFPMTYYLNKVFGSKEWDIKPIPNPKTFEKLKKDKKLKSFEFSVPQERLSHKEQKGIPIIKGLLGLSNNNENTFKITISRGRKKENQFNSKKIIDLMENLLQRKDDFFSLQVISENAKYDLLHGNLIYYQIKVNKIKGRTSMNDFFIQCKKLYDKEISILKNLLSS